MMSEADIGLIGLAVMGQNLVLNMNDHGYTVAVFNRTVSKVDEFIQGPAQGTNVIGTTSLEEFFSKLKRPRKIMLMVKAGEAVDQFISMCLPFLEKGDIIIDGGNSQACDTTRRCQELKEKGFLYVGAGVSGGEEGARHGPSIMPGGHTEAWPFIKEIFQSIAAKSDTGEACCEWVGENGAGHYVKMVHNGIEYGDMQLICEAYHLLKKGLGISSKELYEIFNKWNLGELNSYLIEITSHIFSVDDTDGQPLVDKILDVAGQKGTGKWTSISALEQGVPLTLISEAVFARFLSAIKEERLIASTQLRGPNPSFDVNKELFIQAVEKALFVAKIMSYAQGYQLMVAASETNNWKLNFGGIALMWRGGCIIRSHFLGKIKEAFDTNPSLKNLLLAPYFLKEVESGQQSLREVLCKGIEWGISLPCFSSAIAYYDGYRSATLPANLLQAQRDYFGAHTYERIDSPRGQFFHTNWLAKISK
jgi:6-phosphogluconate dehydrogenase